jgi:hypothetical protein
MKATTDRRSHGWRSRWAAIGAAVAVSLGAGGLMVASAAPSDPSNFISVDPARILDTRTDVGLAGPFISGVAQRLPVTGPVPIQPAGAPATSAQVVPPGATAVVLNVTVIAPQTGGFLSIRPADATGAPAVSNINWAAGGATLANAVTVAMPTSGSFAGQIEVFVDGTVAQVLIDVAGYYQPLAAGIVAESNKLDDITDPTANQYGVAMSVVVEAEAVGIIQIVGSAFSLAQSSPTQFDCRLTRGSGTTTNDSGDDLSDTDRGTFLPANGRGNCTTNGTIAVGAGTHIINLVVRKDQGVADFDDGTLQALFIPGGILDNSDG